jgi:hypothetical protein
MLCRFLDDCCNRDCKYTHNYPPGPHNQICRYGFGCRDKKCERSHSVKDQTVVKELKLHLKGAFEIIDSRESIISDKQSEINSYYYKNSDLELKNKTQEQQIMTLTSTFKTEQIYNDQLITVLNNKIKEQEDEIKNLKLLNEHDRTMNSNTNNRLVDKNKELQAKLDNISNISNPSRKRSRSEDTVPDIEEFNMFEKKTPNQTHFEK